MIVGTHLLVPATRTRSGGASGGDWDHWRLRNRSKPGDAKTVGIGQVPHHQKLLNVDRASSRKYRRRDGTSILFHDRQSPAYLVQGADF